MEKVFLVSRRSIQSDMLARFIQQETGLPCAVASGIEPAVMAAQGDASCLVLWDCSVFEMEHLWEAIASVNGASERMQFALFNAAKGQGLEMEAIANGAHGMFTRSDGVECIVAGIKAMQGRELWFPRKVLSQYLSTSRREVRPQDAKQDTLTPRECEILNMVAQGKSNKAISEELCISVSTVKSHLYNIFGKIEVPNRTQAALWAARNL